MKIKLAFEWFTNPDHLPFMAGLAKGYFAEKGIELELIEPDEHYDGFEALKRGEIQMATNEPLHLIEQFDGNLMSLGMYFETRGGVLLWTEAVEKLKNGETIRISTPVSNDKTDTIGFEIIRRYGEANGMQIKRENVRFDAIDFYHIQHMQEGYDGAWLFFYNFEGIEAKHENMEVAYLDATTVDFANFSALDIFTNRDFYDGHEVQVADFLSAVRRSIDYIRDHPEEARTIYYDYTKTEPHALMDDIINATLTCFDPNFASVAAKEEPILDFFNEIGVTSLPKSDFQQAFLE